MRDRRCEQEGSVLVLALLMTLVMLGVGLTAAWMSGSSGRMSTNINRRLEAMSAAEAGIDRARRILSVDPGWDNLLSGAAGCSGNAFVDGKGQLLCDTTGASPVLLQGVTMVTTTSQTASKAVATGQIGYTVYLRNDDEEQVGTYGANTADMNRRVVVRSEGIGRDGLSYVALEVVLNSSWLTRPVVRGYQGEGVNEAGSSSFSAGTP